jgi:hypothetical protein
MGMFSSVKKAVKKTVGGIASKKVGGLIKKNASAATGGTIAGMMNKSGSGGSKSATPKIDALKSKISSAADKTAGKVGRMTARGADAGKIAAYSAARGAKADARTTKVGRLQDRLAARKPAM